MTEVAGVELAEFVDALRDQIKIAQADADPGLPIEVGPIMLEFTVTTRREGAGKAGVKFWVVDAGVSGKRGKESTQKVTMQLIPHAPDGQAPGARIRDHASSIRRVAAVARCGTLNATDAAVAGVVRDGRCLPGPGDADQRRHSRVGDRWDRARWSGHRWS